QWSPAGTWIAYNGRDGLTVVSPDGKVHRVLQELPWLAFGWAADGKRLYGIRQSDDLRHLTFASIDVDGGSERLLAPDFMPLPVSGEPVRGFSRISGTTFVTSIAHVRSDVWLLDGFELPRSWWEDLFAPFWLRRH